MRVENVPISQQNGDLYVFSQDYLQLARKVIEHKESLFLRHFNMVYSHRKGSMKSRIILALTLCVTCLTLLVGCSSNSAQSDDPQTQNRQYMASVSQIMNDINTQMEDFSDAIKDGEIISLSSQLNTVSSKIDDLKALKVPDAMKDIHSSYVKGAEELKAALDGYVSLYQDIKAPASGSFDYSTYASRLDEVQKHYDAGVEALKDADKKASEA